LATAVRKPIRRRQDLIKWEIFDHEQTVDPMALPSSQIEAFREAGAIWPVDAVGRERAADLLRRFEDLQDREGGALSPSTAKKPHLLLPWLADLVRDPAVVEPVADLLGPDLLCWSATFFAKKPRNDGFVSWHQDSTYWGLSSPDVVTAWVAFTPSTTESGCMRVIPGTHTLDQAPHSETFAADNMLSRGQEIAVDVDESLARDVILAPGQMSLHHVRLVHGSAPNRADHPRIGFAIRYIPTHVRQLGGARDSATLVRGTDRFGHFEPEPPPRAAFDAEAVAFHAHVVAQQERIVLAGVPAGKGRRATAAR